MAANDLSQAHTSPSTTPQTQWDISFAHLGHNLRRDLLSLVARREPPETGGTNQEFLVAATEGAMRHIYLELERLAEQIAYLEKLKAPELRSSPVTPELRVWARMQHTDKEVLAWYNEMKEIGGLELSEFIQDLENPADGTPSS